MQHNLGGIAVIAVIVLPLAGAELAFEIDLAALAEVALGHAGETLGEDRDIVPFRALFLLAGHAILPAFGRRDADIADLAAVLEAFHFRVRPQIADQNDLVDAACHVTDSLYKLD